MFDFTEEQRMIRKMLRKWVEAELVPALDALESEEILPYDLMRKFIRTFGADEFAKNAVRKLEEARAAGTEEKKARPASRDATMGALVSIELSRVSPGFAMAFGASVALAGGAIMRRGTLEQKKRWALPVLTGEKVGAWAITEPGAGSDAFGGMRTTARRADGGYVLRGQKTFISNAPYADTMVVYAKMEHGEVPLRERPIHAFILEKGAAGLTVSKPMRKMGMWSSPTGEIFLDEVFVPKAQLLGEEEKEPSPGRTPEQGEGTGEKRGGGARDVFHGERTGIVPMCFGIIEKCLEASLAYAQERTTWGRPISDYQLVQAKLARMYIHYQNVKNLLLKYFWTLANDVPLTMGEASAMKAYAAPAATECAMEAVQILGGNGYMREFRVEQLARDAKLLQIGGGTDEIQLVTCARAMLRGDFAIG